MIAAYARRVLALRHRKIIIFIVLILAGLGLHAYFTTAQSIFPTMSFSRIDVVAEAGDLPPDQVRTSVTLPLEQAFQTLPAVTNVLSTSSQGSAELRVDFATGTNPQACLQYIYQAVAQIRNSIPAAKNIVAVIVNPNSETVLSYALTSEDLSLAVVRELAVRKIVPSLYGTPGLRQILVTGGPDVEYHVALDPAKLAAQGIGAAEVTKAISDANTVASVGTMQRFYQRYAVIVDTTLHDRASLERTAIPARNGSTIPLGSLGTVSLGVSPTNTRASYDGRHAVIINLYGLPGANTVTMASAVRAKLAEIVSRLPTNVHIHNFWDQTSLVIASQKALRDAILLGALLAVAIMYVFLRDFRLTLTAAAIIPLAMAGAVFVLEHGGQTLNLMSVGGLAVAVGLIIDDTIVVVENIARNHGECPHEPIDKTIAESMAQLTKAMIASSAATLVVLLPLALLSGVSGYFFRALALTLSGALVVSLCLALLFAPIVARALLTRQTSHAGEPSAPLVLIERYHLLLTWALSHRSIVMLASASILALTALLLMRLPSDFLPKMDEGQFEIAYTMPTGTTLSASDAAATKMERIVAGDPAVASVGRLTGIDSNGFSPTQVNQGLLQVRLVEPQRRESYEAVSARLRDQLSAAIPASRYDFHQILEDLINDLSGTPAPLEISVRGDNQRILISLAQHITARIGKIHGVVDTNSGVVYNTPSLRITPNGPQLAALGLTSGDVADALAALSQGSVATSIPRQQFLIPIRVKLGSFNDEPPELASTVSSLFAKGVTTALGDVATLTPIRLASNLDAQNGRLLLRVTANIQGARLSAVTSDVERALAEISFPPGYSADIGGQAAAQRRSFMEFLSAMAIAVVLVFTVMLAAFDSFRLPLVILAAVPLALIGVALGLSVTGSSFNVSSFMGLLLLVGLVVKNGILLIDVAGKRREEGMNVEEALINAGKTRLRPILMTTLATIGGLFPLALGSGQGAEMEQPLAIAVIGGLSTATIFTLVVIPVLYAAFIGEKTPQALP